MKSQGDVLLLVFLPGQEGLREQLLPLRPVTLQTFCPFTLSLPQPGPYHPPRRDFLLTPNLTLPFFSLKPFSLVLSPHTLISSSLLLSVAPGPLEQTHLVSATGTRSGHTKSHLQPPRAAEGKAELPSGQERPVPFVPLLFGSSIFLSCSFCLFPFGTG